MNHIPFPRNRKEVQAFFGRINFLSRFIPNYAELAKGIMDMLRKENEVSWSHAPIYPFIRIKEVLAEALVLVNPDYLVPFYIFSFTSPRTIAAILVQKNKHGYE